MLRSSSEQSLSGLTLNIQSHGPDETGPARESAAKTQMLMESKMSSQTVIHANGRRPSLAASMLVALVGHINDGLSAFARRFMHALHESRQRQANQVIRQYRYLIDDSND
jgi:hypothetical protein